MASEEQALQIIDALVTTGTIETGVAYRKSALVQAMTPETGDRTQKVFERVRAAADAGKATSAGHLLRVEGEGAGKRYVVGARKGRRRKDPKPDRVYVPPPASEQRGKIELHIGDNLPLLAKLAPGSFDLIYIDPPFNTGRKQARTQLATVRDDNGDRVGFHGKRFRTSKIATRAYRDAFDDYLGFLAPRLERAYKLLKPTGSLFLHLDYREVHYAKVLLDEIFGRDSFINEIIWSYDYGARATRRWSPKHDNILWYAKDPKAYCFNYDAIDRIPYMAPELVGAEKAARGKTPTDSWWHTIVSPNGREKTGYPTQKPLGIIKRIVAVHSNPGDLLLDFFAGSGTFGEAGASLGRNVVLIDENPEAIDVMRRRLSAYEPVVHDEAPVKKAVASKKKRAASKKRRAASKKRRAASAPEKPAPKADEAASSSPCEGAEEATPKPRAARKKKPSASKRRRASGKKKPTAPATRKAAPGAESDASISLPEAPAPAETLAPAAESFAEALRETERLLTSCAQ